MAETGAVAVIDQAGRYHHFDADDWWVSEHGYLNVTKGAKTADGSLVAEFAPGFTGVYRTSGRAAAPVVQVGAGGGGGGGAQ